MKRLNRETTHMGRATYDLAGQVAVVTGGGSGIGAACAVALADAGADVVVGDLSAEQAQRVAEELADRSGRVVAAQVDVSDQESVTALGAFLERTYGRLDLAVNSAGVGAANQPVGSHDPDLWRRTLAVNLDGVFLSLRLQLSLMERAGGGSIVNVASILGHRGWAEASAYVASKHAVIGLTRSAALEYANQGIRVNSVSPGFIETPLLIERHDAAARTALGARHPVGRLGLPAEVADVVLWLLSDSASFVTGTDYAVEGGLLAR